MEHQFQFRRGDLEISFRGERAFVEAQVAALLPGLLATGTPPNLSMDVRSESAVADAPATETVEGFRRVSPDFRPRRNISMLDLAAMKSATAPTDLVVVAGYFLEKYMQQEAYSSADLQAQLQSVPAWDCQGVDEVLPVIVMQGYMEELHDHRYTLTHKGQLYVRDGLS